MLTTDKKLLPNFDEDRHCPKAFVTRELKQTDQVYSGKQASAATSHRRKQSPPAKVIVIYVQEEPSATSKEPLTPRKRTRQNKKNTRVDYVNQLESDDETPLQIISLMSQIPETWEVKLLNL